MLKLKVYRSEDPVLTNYVGGNDKLQCALNTRQFLRQLSLLRISNVGHNNEDLAFKTAPHWYKCSCCSPKL